MKCILLAGGPAMGSFPLTRSLPRALLPVANRPLLAHTLDMLAGSGFEEAIICAGGDSGELQEELGSHCRRMLVTYPPAAIPCGPAGCLRLARDRLGDRRFLVIEGSALIDFDPVAFLGLHPDAAAVVASVPAESSSPSWCSSPPAQLPAGVYAFDPNVIEHAGRSGYLDIKQQLLPRLIDAGLTILTEVIDGSYCFVRDLGSLLTANCRMLEGRFGRLFDLSAMRELAPRVWAEGEVSLDERARLIGPILLSPGTVIGEGATLLGPVAVGPGCRIGKGAVIRESVLWGDNEIEDGARISCCILSQSAAVPRKAHAAGALIRKTELTPSEAHALLLAPYCVADLPNPGH